ncbi:MAG: ATP-dependent Clp protease proteolytic subunit [Chloroflexi bacterium]|nr:ATP-dependent Clp protease proteolytic subunit [Chloroflexota bacterium]
MSLFDFFWIFLIISSLTPLLRQRMLDAARVRTMRKLEVKRKSRVIALIHRQETFSFLGLPLARYIDVHDSEQILRAIHLTDPEVPIDLIIHTPGGLVLAAEQIAYALCRHKGPVTVFVPHYAMSGGTMIALAADQIVMDPNAVLGPVDPQLGQWPAASIVKVVEQKDINEVDDQTLIMADMARKALGQVKRTVARILGENNMSADKAEELATVLTSGTWTHDYPISVHEAQELGLPVSTDMPPEVYELMNLYPQTTQRRPSVEYIPTPYAPPARPARNGKD